jgi:hypothetical protein
VIDRYAPWHAVGCATGMENPALRPRRVGEILDAAIKLYLGNARVLMGAAALVVVPLQVLAGIVLISTYDDGRDITTGFSASFSNNTITTAEAHARLGATAINEVTQWIGTAFVLAACVKALSDAYLGQPISIESSLRFGVRRLLPLLALTIIYAIGIVVGFVLLIIPGIWLYCVWSVRVPVLIIERPNPFHALGRSRRLVSGRWWSTAGVLIITAIMVAVVGGVIDGIVTAVALASGTLSVPFAVLISVLSAVVTGVLLQPFSAAVVTVLYYDLRIRHEGYDIALLADQLGLEASSLPGAPTEVGSGPVGPEHVGLPGGPPYWPPPPGWQPSG